MLTVFALVWRHERRDLQHGVVQAMLQSAWVTLGWLTLTEADQQRWIRSTTVLDSVLGRWNCEVIESRKSQK